LRYLPKSESERQAMLNACGVNTPEELFAHLPEEVRLNRPLNLAPGISEYEIVQYFRDRASECANGYASFLGAGVYNHFRPVLVDTVVSRGEDGTRCAERRAACQSRNRRVHFLVRESETVQISASPSR